MLWHAFNALTCKTYQVFRFDAVMPDIGQGKEHKGSVAPARMRQSQARAADLGIAIEKQIQIQSSRGMQIRPQSAGLVFKGLLRIQQIWGR